LADHFQWQTAFKALLATNFVKLSCMVLVVQLAYLFVRTWRWSGLIKQTNPEIRFVDLYWITAIVVSLAIITPAQLGETIKIELLKRNGLMGRLPGFGAFALERIFDILIVACMGIIGLLFGSGSAAHYQGLKEGAILLFALGLFALFLLSCIDPNKKAAHWLNQIRAGSGLPSSWIKTGLLSLVSWGLVGIGWQISLHQIGIDLSLPQILWLISVVTLGSLLSFIPGGFGVADIMTVEVLINMGIAPVEAQAGALIMRAYTLILLVIGLGHLLCWKLFVNHKK
jgi:uncharacterized membrane protein YbhN (UPF0104 family)